MRGLILFFLILFLSVYAGTTDPVKVLKATRVAEAIHIDGKLDEAIWQQTEKASDFIQMEPIPGQPSTFKSEVYFLYDDHAIYVGAKLWDQEPEKILKEYSLRDELGNADNFSVFFDPFKSGLNGFLFKITASGVQIESIVTNQEEDSNWNAVWDSAVSQDDQGWYVEMKIPYSALRFPADAVQEWNVQFSREIRRFREASFWSPVNPSIAGWVQQSGKVTDIKNIKSPVRLSLTPYMSGYINTSLDPSQSNDKLTVGSAYSAGLDLKYGLNDAFTLDMTLIPDFGQVISDKQVLNLTPFEVFYKENRQFFTEGTELFSKENIFYSRRIGGVPLKYHEVYNQLQEGEKVLKNPGTSRLYNATKISGRTSKGTGIGFFNAISGEENAIIEASNGTTRKFKTNPITNYNAVVIDQNLKNNSFVSLMNTNVTRIGQDYDANLTGGFFNLKTKDQRFQVEGFGILSQQFYESHTDRGYSYSLDLGKVSGTWTYGAGHRLDSDKYDPNDMGFLLYPNNQKYYIRGGYNQYKPRNPKMQTIRLSGKVNYERLFKPDVFNSFYADFSHFILFKNRLGAGWDINIKPVETYDYFEPRVADLSRYLTLPASALIGGFISTDYRKPLALDLNLSYRYFDEPLQNYYSFEFSPRIRLNDKVSIFTSSVIEYFTSEPGFTDKKLVEGIVEGLSEKDILFGNRNRLTIENAITGKYIFNAVMGMNLRIRHYWDKVLYQSFGKLNNGGYIQPISFDGLDKNKESIFNQNINIFNIDFQYNWRFAPGSDIIVVWKNYIFNSDKAFDRNWASNLSSLSNAYQENSISLRILYYLDYLYLTPKKTI